MSSFSDRGFWTSGDFEYIVFWDGTAEITSYSGEADILTIPEKLGRFTLTSIGDEAFDGSLLTTIAIPDSVTTHRARSFLYLDQPTLTVVRDSFAAEYCKENGLKYNYLAS